MKPPRVVVFDCPNCGKELKAPLVTEGPFTDDNGGSYLTVSVDMDAVKHRCPARGRRRPPRGPVAVRP